MTRIAEAAQIHARWMLSIHPDINVGTDARIYELLIKLGFSLITLAQYQSELAKAGISEADVERYISLGGLRFDPLADLTPPTPIADNMLPFRKKGSA
jgi:hypothetical protein